jgi:hypothetical protein
VQVRSLRRSVRQPFQVPPKRGESGLNSVRGSQYVSIRYTERLAEAGIEPSVGSKGDSYDNALAETINGLYEAELIHRRAPWKTREAVELATLVWVSWFNHHRLLSRSAPSRRPRLKRTTGGSSNNANLGGVRRPLRGAQRKENPSAGFSRPCRSDSHQQVSPKPGVVHK